MEEELRKKAKSGDKEARELLKIIEDDRELRWKASYKDPDAVRRLKTLEEMQ